MANEQEKELSHEELKAQYAQLLKRNEELEGSQAESDKLVSELTQELSNAQTTADLSPVVVVTHEQKKYRVIGVKFTHKGAEYATADLSKHPEVIAELVESGSELLQLVPAKAKANASK